MLRVNKVAVLLLIAAFVTACGGSGGGSGSASSKLAGVTANNKGTKDVSAGGTVELNAGNYFFAPSVLQGKPGEKVTLHISNSSGVEHNFSIDSQHISDNIDTGKGITVQATFPQSGVLSFYCVFHKSHGMAGALLTSGSASG